MNATPVTTAVTTGVTTAPGQGQAGLPGEVIMRARGLEMSFGQTHALRGVDLDVAAGEVGEVVELPVQRALDAVEAAEHAVVQGVQLVGAHDSGKAGVDDGSGPAGLRDEAVGHDALLFSSVVAEYRATRPVRQRLATLATRNLQRT